MSLAAIAIAVFALALLGAVVWVWLRRTDAAARRKSDETDIAVLYAGVVAADAASSSSCDGGAGSC